MSSKNGSKSAAPEPKSSLTESLFDPERLRLSQDFATTVGVRKLLTTVPVRKPDRQWFCRVHEDAAYRLEVGVIEIREDRETYLVDPAVMSYLPSEVVPKVLFTAINRQSNVFLWPVRLPDSSGRKDEWSRSAMDAAGLAMSRWVRVSADMNLGAYVVHEATAEIPAPSWPDVPFQKLLELGFRDRFIRTPDDPIIQKLMGVL